MSRSLGFLSNVKARPYLIVAALATAMTAGVSASAAQTNNPEPAQPRMERWAADHDALLNAKLAGLKAGLSLSADQEKLWDPFEAAVRGAADLRMQHMQEMMMERMGADQRPSPVDRLAMMADHLSEGGAALKKIADAAKPLYESLNDQQKRIFGWLGRDMMMLGHGPHHGWREGEGRGHMGMGPRGPHDGEPGDMGMMMGPQPDAPGPHGHEPDMGSSEDDEE